MAQKFTCTSWIMSNINTSNFLTPVIYSYHSTSCLVWRRHLPPFSPSGSLEPALVVLFISVFDMNLLACSYYSVKLLSWFSVTLCLKYSCLGVCAIPLCIFPLCLSFSDFVLHSQGLWDKGCHLALLVQCLAEFTKVRSYYKSKLRMIFR